MPDDAAILTELKENFKYAADYWRDIRAEAEKDMRYQAGGPWDASEREERAGRVTLWLDELGQYVNQITNEFRQSKRSVKVNPKGDGANDETALKRAAMIREIEYQSRAQHAYITCGEDMVKRSYGYFKLATEWEPGTMLRRLKVVRIPNPDVIYLDPEAKEADWSDCGWAFEIEEGMREREFKKRFGNKATVTSFDAEHADAAKGWITPSSDEGYRVRVASYWRREAQPNTLYLLENGRTVGSADVQNAKLVKQGKETLLYLPDTSVVRVLDSRDDNEWKVCQYITNGLEILEKSETDFNEIPIIPMFGREVWLTVGSTSKRRFESAVRKARDSEKAYCYVASGVVERLGMDPKTPYEGWEGQFATSTDWANVNKNATGYVEFKLTYDENGVRVADKPNRNLTEPQVAQYLGACEFFRRGVQASMGGSPLPTSAQRQNQKSGVALQEIEQSNDQGNFNFIDNYERAIERAGRMMDAALSIVYDTPREHGFRSEDDQYSVEPINQVDPQSGQPVGFHTGQGDHGVTISTGPSYQSQRDAADDFLDKLAGNEMVFPRVADLVVKLKNLGPIGDQIAERLAPPQAQGLPPEVQQQMAEAQQTVQELQAEVQELKTKAAIEKYKVDEQEKTKRVLGLAELDQTEALAKLEQMLGGLSEKFERLHQAHLTLAQQQHEREMQAAEHQHAAEQAERQHAGALEQQEQAAALQPQEAAE